MVDQSPASPSLLCRPLRALACLSILVLGGSQASALPRGQVEPVPGFLLVQGGPPSAEQQAREDRQAPLSDLNQVLGATRAKLEELTKATATVVADTERRKRLQALQQDNERLSAELEQASARRAKLEQAAELAEARIAELTKAVDAERRESARLNERLAKLRQQNEQLDQSLARAEAAREGAVAEAEKVRAETADKLKLAADQVGQLRAELASRRNELEASRQELARAGSASEQVEARVSGLEEVIERSGAEVKRLKAELAEAKEQLDQAAGAAVAAERARQTASKEAEALRGEAERAGHELRAAREESAQLKAANAELEKQVASLHTDWKSATETARHNLIVMEERMAELNAALDRARGEEAPPTHRRQAKPEPVEDGRTAATPSPPSMAQPPAPEPTAKMGVDQPADGATTPSMVEPTAARTESARFKTENAELEKMLDSLRSSRSAAGGARYKPVAREGKTEELNAALDVARREGAALTHGPQAQPDAVEDERTTAPRSSSSMAQPPAPGPAGEVDADRPADGASTLAMVDPTGASTEVDSGLASFRANVQALNQLELKAGGVDLFSGVEPVAAREVHVSTTAAWDALPPFGKQSYLDSLLDAWVVAQGGEGPAVVRIVDPSGQVLDEKSWP